MTKSSTKSIDEAPAHSELFTCILQQVCETTEWEYGEAWLPAADGTVLELSPVWYVNTELKDDRRVAWQQFRDCSEKFVLRTGEGLPGRVWASQTPEWIANVSVESESYFLRNQIAKAFGVRASFGLPIRTREVQAVLSFFKSQAQSQNMQLMAATGTIVTHYAQAGS